VVYHGGTKGTEEGGERSGDRSQRVRGGDREIADLRFQT